jgi:hypothetical protein
VEWYLTRMRLQGKLCWQVEKAAPLLGRLRINEVQEQNRWIRVAVFEPEKAEQRKPPLPLRDVTLLGWGDDWVSLTGIEHFLDAGPDDPRAYAQTWKLTFSEDQEHRELWRANTRLIKRLRELGVEVEIRPDRSIVIEGETPLEELPTRGKRRRVFK